MSSTTFWTEIRSDPALRRWLLASGLALSLSGVAAILSLPMAGPVRGLAAVAWLAWSAHELLHLLRAYRRCTGLRLAADGEVLVLGRGAARRARLLPGCVVLDGFAWLRLCDDSGRTWGELVRGNHRESEEWRRFQMILRHSRPC